MKLKIKVNEKEVALTEYPTKIITNVIIGMLKTLKGVDQIKSAVVELTEED